MKLLISLLFSAFVIVACGEMEYSPWQTNIDHHNLTAKHLNRLARTDTSFEPFKFVLTGDPQAVVGHLSRVIDVTNSNDGISFINILGDITDMGLRREWLWVGDIIEDSRHPVLTVVGNHDGLTKGKKIYKDMFGDTNYSFIYKDVKFIMWNNNFYEWRDMELDWLESEVLSHDRVVVMSHQPPYSGTLTDQHEEIWKEIRAHPNYIGSFHGHVHNYNYRFEEDTNTIIYTVDRVTGTHFGAVTIDDDGIKIENCTPQCNSVARVSWQDL